MKIYLKANQHRGKSQVEQIEDTTVLSSSIFQEDQADSNAAQTPDDSLLTFPKHTHEYHKSKT